MKHRKISANVTVIHLAKASVLYSYDTPVAAYIPSAVNEGATAGYVRTSKKHSTTTTGHINKWIEDTCDRQSPPDALEITQDDIEHIAQGGAWQEKFLWSPLGGVIRIIPRPAQR